MADKRYKLLKQGLPGGRNFEVRDLSDGDTVSWDATAGVWTAVASASPSLDYITFTKQSSDPGGATDLFVHDGTILEDGTLEWGDKFVVDGDLTANSNSFPAGNAYIEMLGTSLQVTSNNTSQVNLLMELSDGTNVSQIAGTPTALTWFGLQEGQEYRVILTQTGGGFRNSTVHDPDGDHKMYASNGHLVLIPGTIDADAAAGTDANGLSVYDAGGTSAPRLRLIDALGGTELGRLWSSSDDLIAENFVDSGHVTLVGRNSASTSTTLAVFDPDGQSSLYHAGNNVFSTRTEGATVKAVGAGNNAIIQIDDGDGESVRITKASGGQFVLRNFEHGGTVVFQAETTGGSLINVFEADPDTGVAFNGASPISAPTYTPTNVTTDRSFDANSTTVAELADVLGTLISDLQDYGLLQ